MAKIEGDLDPLWQDLDWAIGQMLIMGWDGTQITPQIRHLIEDHHLGSILLTAKNLKSAHQTAKLVQELQTIAHQAGHPQPLLIALDQENGGVNSLFDEDYICQFPSSMGQAAGGSPELAYNVAKATATEVSAVGVNLILGPVLDVLTNARYQPLGVRATGDDPQEVSQYGIAAMNGYKAAGVATCGKHFPSYGNLDFLGSNLDVPIITQTLEELSLSALVPYRNAIATGNLDAMFVGGCGITNPSMNVNHACLSDQVVDDLLRNELGFQGVAISECLEMEALRTEVGVKTGTVMAVEAGCDLVLLCRAYDIQLEAISGLKLGVENELLTRERVYTSLRRVLRMKSNCTNWSKALNPPGISLLSQIHPSHLNLSMKAYEDSITVMRDTEKLLPLNESMHQEEELLLLTPLVKPLPASAMTKTLESKNKVKSSPSVHDEWAHRDRGAIMSGEGVFRELGRSLARARHGKLLHTSYTANGVRPVHENLIHRASTIIIITADANRNLYQTGFTKHVAMMCSMLKASGQKKSLVVVAVSSPYDFAMDKTIGTYICTFDFTELAMQSLVRALFGEFTPRGTLPGTLRKSRKVLKSRQHWLVEPYDRARDTKGMHDLLQSLARASAPNHAYLGTTNPNAFELFNPNIEEAHFVVRNSSTQALYGFCATYYTKHTGIIGALFVDPAKRNLSIGRSLHRRAMRNLLQKRGIKKVQLGMCLPGVFLGIPLDSPSATSSSSSNSTLRSWFSSSGWDFTSPSTTTTKRLVNMQIPDLSIWAPPEGLLQNIQRASISFDLIHGLDNSESVLNHVATYASPEVYELYRLALQETKTCGVVRAKSPVDSLLGTVIIASPGSLLSSLNPALASVSASVSSSGEGNILAAGMGGFGFSGGGGIPTGGILAPIVPSTAQASLVLQGLILMGVRQNKAHKAGRSVVSWVQDEQLEGNANHNHNHNHNNGNGAGAGGAGAGAGVSGVEALVAMGFRALQAFEEVTNSAEGFLGAD
ncbi:glycoside hydrolase family 3 protein [Naviculisporaceae sp. PSN 640]